jgi:hypothetical protein
MIRDRKMYVSTTPFALTEGTTAQRTLILPKELPADPRLELVGELLRVETDTLVVGYTFDLRRRTLVPKYIANPGAHTRHEFVAYRRRGTGGPMVSMKAPPEIPD